MADYSLLGSFSTGGASALNGDLLTKLKDAEKESVLFNIDPSLEKITGVDAETGDALDKIGESDTLMVIKAQALDLMAKMSTFDLGSTDTTAFDAVSASTTGTAAVFDAVDIGGLEPGTNNIEITQLAQRDVFQSLTWTEAEKDGTFPLVAGDNSETAANLALLTSSKLSVEVGGETFDFNIFKDTSVSTVAALSSKTLTELADEINGNDKLIASVETVGTDAYRLVIKSSESGSDNALNITQTNIDIGFGDIKSNTVSDWGVAQGVGSLEVKDSSGNSVLLNTDGESLNQILSTIDADANFSAVKSDGDTKIKIIAADGSKVSVIETGDNNIGFADSSHSQVAQNLNANVDGIDYDTASNTLTIQGNLTMTAVELGKSTIDIQKDTTAILTGVESIIESYNSLVALVDEQTQTADTVMSDTSSLRSILSSIKDNLFNSYGENADLNLFNFGLELDLKGNLSLDNTKFGKALTDNYDDIKNLFLGNTTDTDTAASDATKYMGLGTVLQDYLDNLDGTDGLITRYEANMATRKEKLEKEREAALETLDSKYEAMAAQFSQYGSLISSMESSFSGLSLMIEQSVASK